MNEYRAEIILWALSGVLPLIMLSIWISIDYANIAGMDLYSLKKYFISAFIVRQFTAVWVMIVFEEDVIEGNLSSKLLLPFPVFIRYLVSHISEQFTRVPFVFLMLSILFIIWPSSFWVPSFLNILLASITIFYAFVVRFLLHWCFSMLSFWIEKASAVERLLLIPYTFLSGLVAPIDSFPPFIKSIAMITPFPYFLSFPSLILSGQEVNIFRGLIVLSVWLFLFILISLYAWRSGIRNYSSMGA